MALQGNSNHILGLSMVIENLYHDISIQYMSIHTTEYFLKIEFIKYSRMHKNLTEWWLHKCGHAFGYQVYINKCKYVGKFNSGLLFILWWSHQSHYSWIVTPVLPFCSGLAGVTFLEWSHCSCHYEMATPLLSFWKSNISVVILE